MLSTETVIICGFICALYDACVALIGLLVSTISVATAGASVASTSAFSYNMCSLTRREVVEYKVADILSVRLLDNFNSVAEDPAASGAASTVATSMLLQQPSTSLYGTKDAGLQLLIPIM